MARQTRIRSTQPGRDPMGSLSRNQAIRRVATRLKAGHPPDETLWPLIHLFGIHTEELSEAGVDFEQLRALEVHGACFLGS